MKDRRPNLFIYLGLTAIGIIIGGNCIKYIFGGILTLISIVISSESIKILKWFIAKTGGFVDVLLFLFSIYLITTKSTTIALSLIYASLGFTLLYGPYVRETYNQENN
jgi:hypothetical protein